VSFLNHLDDSLMLTGSTAFSSHYFRVFLHDGMIPILHISWLHGLLTPMSSCTHIPMSTLFGCNCLILPKHVPLYFCLSILSSAYRASSICLMHMIDLFLLYNFWCSFRDLRRTSQSCISRQIDSEQAPLM
jgi:hypothetical protein